MAISKKALVLLVVLVGVIAVVVKFILDPFGSKEVSKVADTTTPKPTPVVPAGDVMQLAETTPSGASEVRQLSVDTTYKSPAGVEPVAFTLTIDKSGVITAAETTVKATVEASMKFQQDFQVNLPAKVVGKKLSDLSQVDKVGKASLTTGAFNASLAQLQAQL